MADYKITCSSTCDLSAEHLKSIGVPYNSFHYIIDGQVFEDDLFQSITREEFYGKIDAGALPTTAQVTTDEVIDFLEPILKEGYDVLHIEFSSGLSGGWASAKAACEMLQEKYPERKVLAVDSLAASSGYGLLVDKAAELKAEGKSIEEVRDWVESNKLRLRHWFFATNLKHLKRGGRVSGPAAVIGSLMRIVPVMDVNSEGKLIVRKKVFGRNAAMKELVNQIKAQAESGDEYCGKVYISNSMLQAESEAIAEKIEEALPAMNGKVLINDIGPVIGAHTGPGTIALFFFSDTERQI
ncbi:MAG: DegV family protein [Clostridia bacterium]|nr:DegV family protein [Clostridia bacterium]